MKTIIETDRLCLREFMEDDVDSLFALDSDPEVMRYIANGEPRTRDEIEQALNRVCAYYQKHPGFGIWLVELKETGEFIGWACLKHLGDTEMIEVGYRLMKDAWNQGYATEAAATVIEYGFNEKGLDKIVAVAHPDNKASQRVLEKCGLQRNGSGTYYGSECAFFELVRS
jgi:ribosomal-protein-alanine N-acetyltransferase